MFDHYNKEREHRGSSVGRQDLGVSLPIVGSNLTLWLRVRFIRRLKRRLSSFYRGLLAEPWAQPDPTSGHEGKR